MYDALTSIYVQALGFMRQTYEQCVIKRATKLGASPNYKRTQQLPIPL